jgi:hypothetical protein
MRFVFLLFSQFVAVKKMFDLDIPTEEVDNNHTRVIPKLNSLVCFANFCFETFSAKKNSTYSTVAADSTSQHIDEEKEVVLLGEEGSPK